MPNNMHEILLNYFENDINIISNNMDTDKDLENPHLQMHITVDFIEINLKYNSICKNWTLFRYPRKIGDHLTLIIDELSSTLELKEYTNKYYITFNNTGKLRELCELFKYFDYFEGRVTSIKF